MRPVPHPWPSTCLHIRDRRGPTLGRPGRAFFDPRQTNPWPCRARRPIRPVWPANCRRGPRFRACAARTAGGRAGRKACRARAALSWRPSSTMRPSSRTAILSAPSTVDSRWAMTIVVRPSISRSKASWTWCSDSESSDEVASSSRMMGASRSMARAMAMRWRWPPESCVAAVGEHRVVAVVKRHDEVVRHGIARGLLRSRRRWRRAGRNGCSP